MAGGRPIVIAGAGIAGLSAAIALARAGFKTIVVERASELAEAGAGIQLSPNAGKALASLGIGEAVIAAVASEPETLIVRSGRAGAELAALPLATMRETRGAPYRTLHRADLQALLGDTARRDGTIDLRLGTEFVEFGRRADGVSVITSDASGRNEMNVPALIGADGVRSRVRAAMPSASKAMPARRTAWRAVAPAAVADWSQNAVTLWLGREGHLVHYPVRGGNEFNLVAIVPGDAEEPSNAIGDRDALLRRFGRWSSAARAVLAAPESWRTWPIQTVDPRGPWSAGPVGLIGDAAHATLPYLAQGGAFALEDAVVLGAAFARHRDSVENALKDYVRQRRPRLLRLQRAARSTGGIYEMGALAPFRDLALRLFGGRLLGRYGWIYGWAPGQPLTPSAANRRR